MSVEAKRIFEERGLSNQSESGTEFTAKRRLFFAKIARTAKLGQWIAPLILIAVDYLMVILALSVSGVIRDFLDRYFVWMQAFNLDRTSMFLTIPLVFIALLCYEKLYTKRMPFWQSAEKLFKISTYTTGIIIGFIYLSKQVETFSRGFLLINWLVSFAFLACARYFTKQLLLKIGLWEKPVIFVGSTKTAELIAAAFTEERHMGYKIVGVIDDRYLYSEKHRFLVFRNIDEAGELIKASRINDVIVAAQGLKKERLMDLIFSIQPHVKNLTIVPDLIGIPMSNMEVDTLLTQKAILLSIKNNLMNPSNRIMKRAFDLSAGSILCLLSLPLMALITLWIRLDSKGPALFNGKRIGKKGKEFICYKFRTMHVNGDLMLDKYFEENPDARDEWERFAKLKTFDPRLTRAGKFLRKFSLDELPQIFNVLKGEMSLVGPRPYLPREKEKMGVYYDIIAETVPGITGLWQTSGRNDVEFEGRLGLDGWYVRNWSFWLDVTLMLKTVGVVLGKRGAY